MRKVLRNSDEVFHYWANQVQSEGRASNVFFDGAKVYSYGKHFCIARILPGGVVASTTRGYSVSTSKHIGQARSAARHLRTVWCYDPDATAAENFRQARSDIRAALTNAERPPIRQTTRDAHKANALRLAENANAYLAALPEDERAGVEPIDTTTLEAVRASLVAAEEAAVRIRAEQEAGRRAEQLETLAKWRTGEVLAATGLYGLPVALRLHKSAGTRHTWGLLPDAGSVGREVIQTSHGAEIPVSFAHRLWASILEARLTGVAFVPEVAPNVGVYRLTKIRGDGSIVVGCHDIAFAEIEGIARALGLQVGEVAEG